MLIDLVPRFLDAISVGDPVEGYHRYCTEHSSLLSAYWRNYILDPDSPHAQEVIRTAAYARRDDLHALLRRGGVTELAAQALARCHDAFRLDHTVDLYLMVGVGVPHTGALVVQGRGIAFVCLEHFTGRANPETGGAGLSPDLLPLWIAHEVAHTVRYTSPTSRSDLARVVADAGGSYDRWQAGSIVPLRELLVNEGLAVAASRAVAPGFRAQQYFGYGSRQYDRLRQLESFQRRIAAGELNKTGLGYQLRYFACGTGMSARRVRDKVLPERSGYYLGYRLVENYVAQRGIAEALRASAEECLEADGILPAAQPA